MSSPSRTGGSAHCAPSLRFIAGSPSGQVARQVARVAERLGLSYGEVTEAVTSALSDPGPTAAYVPGSRRAE